PSWPPEWKRRRRTGWSTRVTCTWTGGRSHAGSWNGSPTSSSRRLPILPGLDGFSLFERLQTERPGVYRVVFTSVHSTEDEQVRALEAGALDYLVKPISLRVVDRKSTRL